MRDVLAGSPHGEGDVHDAKGAKGGEKDGVNPKMRPNV